MALVNLATAASQILSNTMNAVKIVRERAQSSKDNDLKGHLSTLYDNLLSLQEALMLLTEGKRRTEAEDCGTRPPFARVGPELRQVGSCNFYFVGEKGPYCQACYDGKGKLTALSPPEHWSGGIRRRCVLCSGFFYEQPMDLRPIITGGGRGGPQGWMGS